MRLVTLLLLATAAPAAAQTLVFTSDFDTTLPAEIAPGVATLTPCQGYAGLGPTGNRFGGSFLRSPTGNVVTLTLTNLPAHRAIHLELLFAAIDSLDGTGSYPSGDFFEITLDGTRIFRESFANATATQVQSYAPPSGVELARRIDLGFSGPGSYYTDSAYDLGADPQFRNLAHSATSATFTFQITGPGIQPLDDESWAFDRLRVLVDTAGGGGVAPYGASCGPVLAATNAPRLGQPLPFSMSSLPPSTVAASLALGTSSTQLGAWMLPLPLDFLGITGCWLLHDLSLTGGVPMALAGSNATLTLPVPNDPNLLGGQLFAQGWAVAPGANGPGLLFSGGLRLFVGQ